jgi:hypothetical protein
MYCCFVILLSRANVRGVSSFYSDMIWDSGGGKRPDDIHPDYGARKKLIVPLSTSTEFLESSHGWMMMDKATI